MRNESLMVRFRWHAFVSRWASVCCSVSRCLRRFGEPYRLAALLSLLMALNALFATAPDQQRIPPNSQAWDTYYGVVMVGGAMFGTGAVIHKRHIRRQNADEYWLCVLTANHVVARRENNFEYRGERVDIGFGDRDNPIIFERADMVFAVKSDRPDPDRNLLGGHVPDLAVIGVKVNQDIFNRVQSYSLVEPPAIPPPPIEFTIVGYGYTGDEVWEQGRFIGYRERPGPLGIKRFANNTILNADWFNQTGTPFSFVAIEWDLTIGAGAVPGEGVPFHGDSGAPYFTDGWGEINIDGRQIPIATDGIMGVHTWGYREYRHAEQIARGVALIDGYRRWIQAKCALVPEPGSLLVLLSGSGWVLLLYRRRRVSV
jgi:hypothetical protein